MTPYDCLTLLRDILESPPGLLVRSNPHDEELDEFTFDKHLVLQEIDARLLAQAAGTGQDFVAVPGVPGA